MPSAAGIRPWTVARGPSRRSTCHEPAGDQPAGTGNKVLSQRALSAVRRGRGRAGHAGRRRRAPRRRRPGCGVPCPAWRTTPTRNSSPSSPPGTSAPRSAGSSAPPRSARGSAAPARSTPPADPYAPTHPATAPSADSPPADPASTAPLPPSAPPPPDPSPGSASGPPPPHRPHRARPPPPPPPPTPHPHTNPRHIRPQRRNPGQRRGGRPRLPDHLDIRLGLQQVTDPPADHLVIIKEEHRDRLLRLVTDLLTVHWAGHDDSLVHEWLGSGVALTSLIRFLTSTTPSTSQIIWMASATRSWCRPTGDSAVPVSVTTPCRTITMSLTGSANGISSMICRASAVMSWSGRRKTLSRSRRLTMPISLPSGSTTGSRRT